MLILNRLPDEDILIGDDIVIRVIGVRHGVTAPRGLRVDRREVRERIERGEPDPKEKGRP